MKRAVRCRGVLFGRRSRDESWDLDGNGSGKSQAVMDEEDEESRSLDRCAGIMGDEA
jgi:hypothetical protein